jgi:hypothetical protein
MRSRLIDEQAGSHTFVLVFEAGDEAMAGLSEFAREQGLSGAHFTAIGAFSSVVLGYFDWEKKDYEPIRLDEQVEVVALIGDVALEDDAPAVHAHAVVAGADGHARGGHLLEGQVRPTLEVVLIETPAHLRKRYDPDSGLALIVLDETDASAGLPQGEARAPHVPDEQANIVGEQGQRLVEEEAEIPRSSTEEGGGLES